MPRPGQKEGKDILSFLVLSQTDASRLSSFYMTDSRGFRSQSTLSRLKHEWKINAEKVSKDFPITS